MKIANIHRLTGAFLLAGIVLTGCTKDNTLDEIVTEKQPKTSSNAFVQALESIDGVRNVQIKTDKTGKDTTYFFSFRQLIDHDDPQRGTFYQQVAINFKGFDKNVVLYTHGYNMPFTSNTRIVDLSTQLDANQVNVEHRYFGSSLPEPADALRFAYFNAKQQSCDLHAIVQALKQGVFKTGRWASTGLSKDGITSALYAYYSDQYGWNDIDVYVPFCAPFLTGSVRNGKFSCMDSSTGVYLEQVSGVGYPEGTTEAVACQRLHDIPYYFCSNKRVREACNKYLLKANSSEYLKIVEQYNQKSPNSTGNMEKDVTALAYNMYYECLFSKFSYVPFYLWSKLVPDPAKAVTDDEELEKLCTFVFMDKSALRDSLHAMAARGEQTRSIATDVYDKFWNFIHSVRNDSSAPYYVQAFMELGAECPGYNNVDGTFLTKEQAMSVNDILTVQKRYEGLYKQDEGRLMTSFRQWVATEVTQNIIFVYAYNDPWTGGRPDDTAVSQNPHTVMVIDPIAVHLDYFLDSSVYTTESKDAIIAALDRFLK